MTVYVIPTIGMRGYFRLKAPFDTKIVANQEYTCQGVRNITDHLANNEDPLTTLYLNNGLTETDYLQDRAENMYIVSLQSQTGLWLSVPVRYIASYPTTNGMLYHEVVIGVGLGPVPTNLPFSVINELLSDVVYNSLGIRPAIEPVQVTAPVVVSYEKHQEIETIRQSRVIQKMSNLSKLQQTEAAYQQAIAKIKKLEQYIVAKGIR